MLRAPAAAAVAALALAPAAAGQEAGLTGTYDPAASGPAVAVVVGAPGAVAPAVVVRRPGVPVVRYEGAWSPALDGERLAYVDAEGVRVVRWRTGEEIARLDGPFAKPALDWPRLAYVRLAPAGRRLDLIDLRTGLRRVVTGVGPGSDLGRPALAAGLIAWHTAAGRRSELRVSSVARLGRGRLIASSVTGLQVNPSLGGGRVLWVEQAGSDSYLRLRALRGGPVRTLATVPGARRFLWSTALGARTAYVTRWTPNQGRGLVLARRWR